MVRTTQNTTQNGLAKSSPLAPLSVRGHPASSGLQECGRPRVPLIRLHGVAGVIPPRKPSLNDQDKDLLLNPPARTPGTPPPSRRRLRSASLPGLKSSRLSSQMSSVAVPMPPSANHYRFPSGRTFTRRRLKVEVQSSSNDVLRRSFSNGVLTPVPSQSVPSASPVTRNGKETFLQPLISKEKSEPARSRKGRQSVRHRRAQGQEVNDSKLSSQPPTEENTLRHPNRTATPSVISVRDIRHLTEDSSSSLESLDFKMDSEPPQII